MTQSSIAQIMCDVRDLLHDDEVEQSKENIHKYKSLCLEDPNYFYDPEQFKPRFVVWELTLRCNMRCAHCGSAAGKSRPDELNTEEALDLARQLGELGCERLTLLGGEPLIREDWEQITAELRRAGVRVNIITNGWLTATPEMIHRIKNAGLTTLAFSIDGYAETHDQLRKKPGSFERILRSIDLAKQHTALTVAAVTTVTKPLIDDLPRIYDMLVDKGVRLWQMQLVSPLGRLDKNDPIVCTPTDVKQVADFIVEKQQEKKLRIDPADNIGYFGRWELDRGFRSNISGRVSFWNGCQAGCQVAGVVANGDITGCLSLPSEDSRFVEGNIRQASLKEIWTRKGAFAFNRQFSFDNLSGACKSCEYRGLCRGGCTSHAVARTGNPGQHPDCLCHHWR